MWKTETTESLCSKLNIPWVHLDNTSWRKLAKIFRSSKFFFQVDGMHLFLQQLAEHLQYCMALIATKQKLYMMT